MDGCSATAGGVRNLDHAWIGIAATAAVGSAPACPAGISDELWALLMTDVHPLPSCIVFAYDAPVRGTTWPGIGMALLEAGGVVTDVLLRAESIIKSRLDWSLLEVLRLKNPLQAFMSVPVNTAIQLALTAAWHDRGIRPAAVLGRCGGEYAAAHASGAISFEDAVNLACRTSRLTREVPARGKVLGVLLSENEAKELCGACPAPFAVVSEGPGNSIVIVCEACDLGTVGDFLKKHKVLYFFCKNSVAMHSWIVEDWREEVLCPLQQNLRCSIPIYSGTSQGRLASEVDWTAHFWRVLREPVFVRPAIRAALDDGLGCFVEIGGHPTLREFILGEARARNLLVDAFATMEYLQSLREVMSRTEDALRVAPPKLPGASHFVNPSRRTVDMIGAMVTRH